WSFSAPGQTAVSPDGTTLACSLGRAVRFFDVTTGKKRPQPPARSAKPGFVTWICYSADGKLVVGGTWTDPACVHFWDAATSRLLRTFATPKDKKVTCCVLTPDGRLLACASAEERPWDPGRPLTPEDKIEYRNKKETVRHLRLWEVASGKE